MLQKLRTLKKMYMFNPKTTPPREIYIEITGACNLECPNCPRTYSRNKRGHMTDDLFHTVILQVAAVFPRIEHMGFHWFGEIELRKNYHNLLSWAKGKLPYTEFGISTNLTSKNKETVRKLLLSGVNNIGIWPDGFSEESYSLIRPGSSFQLVKENILFLLEEREKMGKTEIGIGIGMVRNTINQKHIGKFYQEFEFIKKYENTGFITVDSHDFAGQVPSDMILKSVKKYTFKVPKPCQSPFTTLAVSSNGFVTLCCYDMDLQLNIGKITGDNNIGDIWASSNASAIRDRMKWLNPPELCRQCHGFYFNLTPKRIIRKMMGNRSFINL
jgi:radical SAM protein with 4Fe4S-binding SPASM domain